MASYKHIISYEGGTITRKLSEAISHVPAYLYIKFQPPTSNGMSETQLKFEVMPPLEGA